MQLDPVLAEIRRTREAYAEKFAGDVRAMITDLRERQQMAGTSKFVPPLEPGDRLTRPEFERRYSAMPNLKKAELIEGIVYTPPRPRFYRHAIPHAHIVVWLGVYNSQTPGVIGGDNATVRLDLDNEPQPDALLMIEPECGGQARISGDDCIEGAPELVVEIASSSASFDAHTKLHVYRRNGVSEYFLWRTLDKEFDWFTLHEGEFRRLTLSDDGLVRSQVFPGLWLDVPALLRGDLATVQHGLATSEHGEFVKGRPDAHRVA
jgi:Uma2 family endonuclease